MKLIRLAVRAVLVVAIVATAQFFPQRLAWGAPETRSHEVAVTSGQVVESTFPATHAVVEWDGDEDASLRIRGADADGAWGEWKTVSPDADAPDRPTGFLLLNDASKVQVEVVAGDARNLTLRLIDTVHGPRKLEVVKEAAGAIDGATASPEIQSRAQWGANEGLRKGSPSFASTSRFIVHHTDTANNDPNPAATVRAILAYHTQSNGWDDIGYNFLIDQQGRIYEGRYAGGPVAGENAQRLGVIGAHAQGYNTGSIGISLLGNFTTASPTDAQMSSLNRLIAWKADRLNIDLTNANNVVGHRDVNQTSCPGNVAESKLPQIRQDANAIKMLSYPAGNTPGYWVAATDGRVLNYGAAVNHGSMAQKALNSPIASMTRTPSGNGYWLMGADGGIFSFGDAKFFGSMGGKPLNSPVVGLAPTPSGQGYWLVAKDGGTFAFGDAKFFGSMGGQRLNQPVVGMASTPSGQGYWMVASDGGIFSFGDAAFYGSTGAMKLNQPVVTIAAAPNGGGYWLVAKDGGVFSFNTRFMGSIPMLRTPYKGTAQAAATSTGLGYYMLATDGGIYSFGDARFWGAPTGNVTAAGIALMPS